MLRVMLIDDTGKDLGILKDALAAAGYEVSTAQPWARDLIDRVERSQPDVIIMDSDSPSRDVLEHVCVVSREARRPIVLFTEDGNRQTIDAALRAGVTAYIVSGMQPERLQTILDVAIARFDREQELRDELAQLQEKLAERKVVERAKGILMDQRKCSEDEAYKLLRKLAMDRNLKLLEVARQVVDVVKLLG